MISISSTCFGRYSSSVHCTTSCKHSLVLLLMTRMKWTVWYAEAYAPAYQTVHLILYAEAYAPAYQTVYLILYAEAYAPAHQTVHLILYAEAYAPAHQTVPHPVCRSICSCTPDSPLHPCHHQSASSVHYITSCKHRLVLLRMGENIARNMLS